MSNLCSSVTNSVELVSAKSWNPSGVFAQTRRPWGISQTRCLHTQWVWIGWTCSSCHWSTRRSSCCTFLSSIPRHPRLPCISSSVGTWVVQTDSSRVSVSSSCRVRIQSTCSLHGWLAVHFHLTCGTICRFRRGLLRPGAARIIARSSRPGRCGAGRCTRWPGSAACCAEARASTPWAPWRFGSSARRPALRRIWPCSAWTARGPGTRGPSRPRVCPTSHSGSPSTAVWTPRSWCARPTTVSQRPAPTCRILLPTESEFQSTYSRWSSRWCSSPRISTKSKGCASLWGT